jgi:hypothetical protein
MIGLAIGIGVGVSFDSRPEEESGPPTDNLVITELSEQVIDEALERVIWEGA